MQNDRKSLYSCLIFNIKLQYQFYGKTLRFCQTVNENNILFDVILSHLSEESKDTLKNQGIDLFTETHQQLYLTILVLAKRTITVVMQ